MPHTPPSSPRGSKQEEKKVDSKPIQTEGADQDPTPTPEQATNEQVPNQNTQPRAPKKLLTMFGFSPNAIVTPCPEHGFAHLNVIDFGENFESIMFATIHGTPSIMLLIALESLNDEFINRQEAVNQEHPAEEQAHSSDPRGSDNQEDEADEEESIRCHMQ